MPEADDSKKSMTKLFKRFGIVALLLFLLIIGGWFWWKEAVAPVDGEKSEKIFVISPNENVRTIATRLKAEGLIRNKVAFFILVKQLGLEKSIQSGDFRLSTSQSAVEIAESLTHGALDVWVTIPEGWRNEEIAQRLSALANVSQAGFLEGATEGYMFPDTYLIPKEASASVVINLFKSNFEKRVTPDMRKAIEAQGLTFEQGIVLASIVEREGVDDQDRPIIAGILLTRLNQNHPLEVDATLQYALGYQADTKTWWKKALFSEDKKIDSPFNSYKNVGLPPRPISNPGLGSIQAVAHPKETDYFFYIHGKNGEAHYAKTLEEHEENIAKFL